MNTNMNDHERAVILRPLVNWLDAIRPRTLPLALSSVAAGGFLAIASGTYRWATLLFALVTSMFLQILSNLANDYGDAIKGTDNDHRAGPQRTVQSGRINAAQMKNAIILVSLLSVISGGVLVCVALGNRFPLSLVFFLLGIAAIGAAVRYTIGAKAYGYKGLGDLFVFIFFGLVGVCGTWFLNTLHWEWDILLPGAAVGFLCTGVLNLNNMRDMDNDRASGKRTVAALFGYRGARIYHLLLIFGAFLLVALFVGARYHRVWDFLFVLTLPLFVRDAIGITRTKTKQKLDPFLKRLSLSSLLFSLLFGVGLLL